MDRYTHLVVFVFLFSQDYDCVPLSLIKISLFIHRLRVLGRREVSPDNGTPGGSV